MFQTLIHVVPTTIANSLACLGVGLTPLVLRQAVTRGQVGRNRVTRLHPANAAGTLAYFETVVGLRAQLLPQGWEAQSVANFELTTFPETQAAIVVASGDRDTGRVDGFPHTRNDKGNRTVDAIKQNQGSLALLPGIDGDVEQGRSVGNTWLLLYFEDSAEVRLELSMPIAIDENGRVSGWRVRHIFDPITVDPTPLVELVPDYSPEIDVAVKRRA